LGCAYDAKNNAAKVYIPRAVRAGADVLTHAQVMAVLHDRGRVQGVRGAALEPRTGRTLGAFIVEAPRVCLSASATGTPAILKRSEVPDASGQAGRTLRTHPAVVVAGEMDEEIRAWEGIPQSVECTEHLDFTRAHAGSQPPPGSRIWIVPAFAHPVGTATMMPGIGAAHRTLMTSYPRLAVLTAMLHDRTPGRVRPQGELDLSIALRPDAQDRAELALGLQAAARLLLAAGARRVVVPTDPPIELRDERGLGALASLLDEPGRIDLMAVHPMGSVAMGDDPETAPVDSRGRHRGLDGLWVGDGSLFPSSIGGPPQLSIYALGHHVGEDILTTR
jgi:choline dehydrogenase-like flavoprotein